MDIVLIGELIVSAVPLALSATIIVGISDASITWLSAVIMMPLLLLLREITPKRLAFGNRNCPAADLMSVAV